MKIDFKNISFMTDFENGLRKALKMNLMMLLFMDAIFILLKIFGIKPKNMIYLKKPQKKYKYIFIFSMKIYPYILEEEKDEFLDNMENYIKNINNKCFSSFFEYFKKFGAKQIF